MNSPSDNQNNPRFLSPGAVSVNERGTVDDGLSKKMILIAIMIGLLIVAGVYVFNQWRATGHSKKEKALITLSENNGHEAAKRIFEAIQPISRIVQPECKDIVLLDKAGKPILDKEGQPVKIACDGKVVPELDFNQAPPPVVVAPAAPETDRYTGDVLADGGNDQEKKTGIAIANAKEHSKTEVKDEVESRPSKISRVTATKIGDRNYILAKGAHIDCALTTRVISDVAGFASCVLTNNIYSDNGKVLLLERGSDVQGEYAATMDQGQRRLAVLWTRIKTPHGVVINLDSPGADGLGAMGLEGYVDNHWWERLGAAFLLSFVKDLIAYQTSKDSATAGTLIYQNSVQASSQMADRILSQTINIKPTFYKNQGDRASIYVARDLDFSTVYALRAE